jgi:hypothetical protein
MQDGGSSARAARGDKNGDDMLALKMDETYAYIGVT